MTLVADVMEPLVLADGTKIDPQNGKVIRNKAAGFVEIPSAREAQDIVARTRRSIAELPLAPENMNAVSLVLFYTMWGLRDQDIAITVGVSVDQVKQIKKLEQYSAMMDDIRKSVLDHEANDIRTIFQNNAAGAAMRIVSLASEEEGVLGFKASQDILDRAGFRPADVVEHNHNMKDALRIVHIKQDDRQNLPAIETTYRDVTNGDRTQP